MKRSRWNENVLSEMLALKLCEEAAEVGKEITTAAQEARAINVKNLNEELDHVEHLVSVLRKKFPRKG